MDIGYIINEKENNMVIKIVDKSNKIGMFYKNVFSKKQINELEKLNGYTARYAHCGRFYFRFELQENNYEQGMKEIINIIDLLRTFKKENGFCIKNIENILQNALNN